MRALLVVSLLAGCATGEMAPEGTDFVALSTSDGTVTIFANDMLLREVPGARKVDIRVKWTAMPEGSYARARAMVERDMQKMTVPNLDHCLPDMPVTMISVSPPVAGVNAVRADCQPHGAVGLAENLRTLLPPWPRNY